MKARSNATAFWRWQGPGHYIEMEGEKTYMVKTTFQDRTSRAADPSFNPTYFAELPANAWFDSVEDVPDGACVKKHEGKLVLIAMDTPRLHQLVRESEEIADQLLAMVLR